MREQRRDRGRGWRGQACLASEPGWAGLEGCWGPARGPLQAPTPSWQAGGPAAVTTALRAPSWGCGVDVGFPDLPAVPRSPREPVSYCSCPPPPPGHELNPPRAPDQALSQLPGAGRACQESGPRKSFQQLPSFPPVLQTRLMPGAVSVTHVAASSLSCCRHSGGVGPVGPWPGSSLGRKVPLKVETCLGRWGVGTEPHVGGCDLTAGGQPWPLAPQPLSTGLSP